MRLLFFNHQTYFFLLLIIVIGLCFQLAIYKIGIILITIHWIVSGNIYIKLSQIRKNNYALILTTFYMLYAVSLFWSNNIFASQIDLVLKVPILLLPIIIFTSKSISDQEFNQLILFFAFSSVFLNVCCVCVAFFNFLSTGDANYFFYHKLTLNMHTAYQSMMTCFSVVVFVYSFVCNKIIYRRLVFGCVAFQLLFILMLSSRMQILIMAVIIPFFLITYYFKQQQIIKGIIYIILIFISANLFMSIPGSLNYRYKTTVKAIKGEYTNSVDPRQLIWKASANIIEKNWLMGVGVGDAKDVLLSRYRLIVNDNILDSSRQNHNKLTADNDISKRYEKFIDRAYNFHNQYLQTFATVGILGIILMLYILLVPFINSIISKDYLLMSFIFIIGMSFLTESMLERQAGVIFFIFFYVLLVKRLIQNRPS